MAVIHQTSLSPTKLELLSGWLPQQVWYAGSRPQLARAGGFRLDDPQGDVGIEVMVVADRSGDPVSYLHLPMTYRGEPLAGAEAALIGTSAHGVLGRRWIYDAARDPVFVAQLLALMAGDVEAQAQSESNTVDRSVISRPADVASGQLRVLRSLEPEGVADPVGSGLGYVSATWQGVDGTQLRGTIAVLGETG